MKNPGWWRGFAELLAETNTFLTDLFSGPFAGFKPNEMGKDLFRRWKEGELTDDEVVQCIRESVADTSK